MPTNMAIIVHDDMLVEEIRTVLKEWDVSKYILIVSAGHAGTSKSGMQPVLHKKGSYPQNMLDAIKNSPDAARPEEYDLLISFQPRLDLCGVDARCLGFTTFAVVPCPCSLFVRPQLTRAMWWYGAGRQNYGK
jgi:hypothetical protein